MCTVVFIPHKNKQYFASLRDESPIRPRAIAPKLYKNAQANYLMPKDALACGTWVGINEFKNVIILLNGGFKNHKKKETYLKSRGAIVNELLLSVMPVIDWQLMDLSNIEPFTLVVWSDNNLFELVWNGFKKHRNMLDSSSSYIWSSSTLYSSESKNNREEWFKNWIAMMPQITKLSVFDFFKSSSDIENGFIINRNEKVKTLSYSFIELHNTNAASLDYFDLQSFKHSSKSIELVNNLNSCSLENFTVN